MGIQPGQITLASTAEKKADVWAFRFLRFLSFPALATVEISTVDEKGQRSGFTPIRTDEPITYDLAQRQLFIRSTVPGVITFQWSAFDRIQTVSTINVVGGLDIEGQYQNFTPTALSPATPKFVTVGVFQDAGGFTGVSYPLASHGHTSGPGDALAVGTDDREDVFLVNSGGGTVSTFQGYAALRFAVTGTWTGNPILVDGNGRPIPFWDDLGRSYTDGLIRGNGTYMANIAGGNGLGIDFASIPGSGQVSVDWCASARGRGSMVLTHPLGERLYAILTAALGAGANVIIAPIAGKKIRVYGYTYSFDTPVNAQFNDSTGPALSATGYGVLSGFEVDEPVFETTVGGGLDLTLSAPVPNGSCQVRYEVLEG